MRRSVAVLTAFPLVLAGCVLAGCGNETPSAQPSPPPPVSTTAPASTTPPPTTTSTTPPPSTPATTRPPAPPSSNVKDCFDGDCTLLLSKPVKIPLDSKTFHYSSMQVTAIGEGSLTFHVDFGPGGGGSTQTLGVGGGGAFSFRGSPGVEVRLESASGRKATLILQPGPIE